jgi:predicted acylesterase/phospholipase RssA
MGVLARLIEEGIVDDVTEWYGCSGGCLIATLGALGASPSFIKDIAEHFEMSRIVTPDPKLLSAFTESWGISDGSALVDFYARVADIWCPGASQWTFADLARERPGVRLTFMATNVSRGCQELYNIERTPNAQIIREGMRASMSIPMFFTPFVNSAGEYICDGAITEYYVWDHIPDKGNTLVIGCDDSAIMGRPLTPCTITSVGEYVSRAFQIGHHYNSASVPRNWIAVNDKQSFLHFKITREERLELFRLGEIAANRWLSFRRQAAAGGTGGSRPGYEDRSTLSSGHPSPDRTSGSHQSRTRLQRPYPSRDSPHGGRLPARRWSL